MNDAEQWDDRWIAGVDWPRERLGQPDVRVVDVRPPDRYARAHIPGAVNSDVAALKASDSSPAGVRDFERRLQAELRRLGVQPDDAVVFYEDFSGASAAYGVWMLDYAGVATARLLDGGLAAWIATGGPATREAPSLPASAVEIAPRPKSIATADDIVAGLMTPAPMLLDTRTDLELATGVIPGAVHLEWVEHLRPDGSLRSPAEARRRFAEAGIRTGETRSIVPYCGSGYRAAHAYVLLRALGFGDVRNYAASWSEWGRRPDLPVARPAS
ncbi:MAG TPA: rhodanese-like domain-containing protein [Thermomicrobiales bacterium]|nr:rhodanese-like domain-containing protein [Thermomicrobiales bacterium]